MRMPPQQKMSNLFQQIDTAGNGSISKSQFSQAFNSSSTPAAFKAIGLDAAFSKLDPSGTGSVSKQDFISGMKSIMTHGHHRQGAAEASKVAAPQTLEQSIAALNAVGNGVVPVANAAIGNTISVSA
jgi:hypothetical protein